MAALAEDTPVLDSPRLVNGECGTPSVDAVSKDRCEGRRGLGGHSRHALWRSWTCRLARGLVLHSALCRLPLSWGVVVCSSRSRAARRTNDNRTECPALGPAARTCVLNPATNVVCNRGSGRRSIPMVGNAHCGTDGRGAGPDCRVRYHLVVHRCESFPIGEREDPERARTKSRSARSLSFCETSDVHVAHSAHDRNGIDIGLLARGHTGCPDRSIAGSSDIIRRSDAYNRTRRLSRVRESGSRPPVTRLVVTIGNTATCTTGC